MSEEALSSHWRVRRSNLLSVELSNALQSLATLVGLHDDDTRHLSWSAESQGGIPAVNDRKRKIISIDPKYATMEIPISPDHFDILCGLAAHESIHTAVLSEVVRDNLEYRRTLFPEVWILLEEIYVDHYLRRKQPLLHRYLQKARKAYNAEPNRESLMDVAASILLYGNDMPTDLPPSVSHYLVHLFEAADLLSQGYPGDDAPNRTAEHIYLAVLWRRQLYTKVCNDLDADSSRHLAYNPSWVQMSVGNDTSATGDDSQEATLDGTFEAAPDGASEVAADDLSEAAPDDDSEEAPDSTSEAAVSGSTAGDASVTPSITIDPQIMGRLLSGAMDDEASKERLAQMGYEKPQELVTEAPSPTKALVAAARSKSLSLHPSSGEALPADLAKQVEQQLELGTVDYSADVGATAFGNTVLLERPSQRPYLTFNPTVASDLRYLQELQNASSSRKRRWQPRGSIDHRNLWRAGLPSRTVDAPPAIFQTSYKQRHTRLELVLLLDCSGSMASPLRQEIYNAAASVYKVLPEAEVYGYSSKENSKDTANVENLRGKVTRKPLETEVPLQSPIPTGLTPSAWAIRLMSVLHPKALIIHFTDGGNNVGPRVATVLEEIFSNPKNCETMMVHILLDCDSHVLADYNLAQYSHRNLCIPIATAEEFPGALKQALRKWYPGAILQ